MTNASDDNKPATADWARIDGVFQRALEQPEEERRHWVERECAAEPGLRDAVLELLDADAPSERLFEAAESARDAMVAANFDDTHSVDLAGKRIGVYRLGKLLGAGGMGAVYLAERDDGEFQQTVAVKILPAWATDAQTVARFRAERQILSSLCHPNITRLIDGGQTGDGYPYLITDYIDGVAVNEYVQQQALSLQERLELFLIIADAVGHAHEQGVVHRDLKPANILVDRAGRPHLLDFGIAKLQAEAASWVTLPRTMTGFSPMTPGYESPEQRAGRNVETTSDVYQLGLLLYELVTGQRARRSETDARGRISSPSIAVQTSITRDDPAEASDTAILASVDSWSRSLSGDIDTIVMKALRDAPSERYESVSHMRDDVQRHLDGTPIQARPEPVLQRAASGLRASPNSAWAALLVVVMLVAIAVVLRSPGGGNEAGSTSPPDTPAVVEASGASTESLAAFRAYERGRALLDQRSPDSVVAAIGHFEQSLEADPAYAEAWTGLADGLLTQAAYLQTNDPAVLERAAGAIDQALSLDPNIAKAWTAKGTLAYIYRDAPGAIGAYDQAIELDPAYASAHQLRAYQLGIIGRFEEAIASAQRATELDPLSPEAFVGLSGVSLSLGRFEESITAARRARELSPAWASTQLTEAQALFGMGDFEGALRLLEGLQVPWAGGAVASTSARALLALNRDEEAEVLLAQLADGPDAYAHAVVLADLGEREQAWARLEASGPLSEFAALYFQGPDRPLFDPTGDDPRYAAALRSLHAAWGITDPSG